MCLNIKATKYKTVTIPVFFLQLLCIAFLSLLHRLIAKELALNIYLLFVCFLNATFGGVWIKMLRKYGEVCQL